MNELKQLDANLFGSMPNLQYLNVGKNLLTTLEVDKNRLIVDNFLHESSAIFMHGKYCKTIKKLKRKN